MRNQIFRTSALINGFCTGCLVTKLAFKNPLTNRIKNRLARAFITGICIGGSILAGIGLLPESRKLVRLSVLPVYYKAVQNEEKLSILNEFNENFIKYEHCWSDERDAEPS